MALEVHPRIRVTGSTAPSGTAMTFHDGRSCSTPSKGSVIPCSSSASPRWSSGAAARSFVLCPAPLLRLVARCEGVDLAFDGSSLRAGLSCARALAEPCRDLRHDAGDGPEPACLISPPIVCSSTTGELSWPGPSESISEALRTPGESGPGRSAKPFLIGIAWQGNPAQRRDHWRSFPLAQFAALADAARRPADQLAGRRMAWTSSTPADRRFPSSRSPAARRRDFMETAAIMTHLDLVITPDTAVAHLAGSLGVRSLDRRMLRGRLALSPRPRRHAVVSHHEAFPPDHARRLGQRLPADDRRTTARA